MRERHNFIGEELSETERKSMGDSLADTFGPKIVEGENRKTPERIKLISKLSFFLNKEMERVGAESGAMIHPHTIHFFDNVGYKNKFPDKRENAFYSEPTDQIYINEDAFGGLLMTTALIHEMVHKISPKLWRVSKNVDEAGNHGVRLGRIKQGYSTVNFADNEGLEHGHFQGFNELVTQMIAVSVIRDNALEIVELTKPTPDEAKQFIEQLRYGQYENYIKIFTVILRKISEKSGQSYDDLVKKYERGYFEGSVMHLREIDEYLGRGSLRVLAAIGSGTQIENNKEMLESFYSFFNMEDGPERDKLAEKILIPRENEQYDRVRNR